MSIAPAAPDTRRSLTAGLTLSVAGSAPVSVATDPITIGSGPRCAVRVAGSGVKPLCVVVTLTPQGVIARRWSADMRLNGGDFTEAVLKPGDRLQVADTEIVVSADQPAAAPEAAETPERVAESPWTAAGGPAPGLGAAVADAAEDPPQVDSPASGEPPLQRRSPNRCNDPAVPGHLLRSWQGLDGASNPEGAPATEAGSRAAESPVDQAPVTETPITEPPATEPPAEEIAVEQLVEPEGTSAPPTVEPRPAVDTPVAEASDLWLAAEADLLENAAHVQPEVPQGRLTEDVSGWAAQFAGEPEAVAADSADDAASESAFEGADSTPEPLEAGQIAEPSSSEGSPVDQPTEPPAEVIAATHRGDDATDEALRARLAAGRQRVTRLVALVRAAREERDVSLANEAKSQTEHADRLAEAEERCSQAETRHREAEEQIERLVAQLTDLEATHRETVASADEVARYAEALEQRLAAFEAAFPTTPELDPSLAETDDAVAEETASLGAVQVDAAAEADEVPSVAELEVSDSLVESLAEQPAIEPIREEPTASDLIATAGADLPLGQEESSASADAAAAAAWGIERLSGDGDAAESNPWSELPSTAADEPTSLADDEPTHPVAPAAEPASPEAADSVTLADYEPATSEPSDDVETAAPPAEAAEEPSAEPAGSFIERYAHLLPEDDGSVEPVEPVTPLTPAPAPVAPHAEHAGADDEESIDDYMRKLLGRMRGDEAPTPVTLVAAPTPVASTPEPSAPVAEAAPQLPAEPKPEPIRDLQELKRAGASAPTTDLGALRQIANQSARHAIDVASTKQQREKANSKALIGVLGVGLGAFLAVTSSSLFGLQMAGGLTSIALGGWLGVTGLRHGQSVAAAEEMDRLGSA